MAGNHVCLNSAISSDWVVTFGFWTVKPKVPNHCMWDQVARLPPGGMLPLVLSGYSGHRSGKKSQAAPDFVPNVMAPQAVQEGMATNVFNCHRPAQKNQNEKKRSSRRPFRTVSVVATTVSVVATTKSVVMTTVSVVATTVSIRSSFF